MEELVATSLDNSDSRVLCDDQSTLACIYLLIVAKEKFRGLGYTDMQELLMSVHALAFNTILALLIYMYIQRTIPFAAGRCSQHVVQLNQQITCQLTVITWYGSRVIVKVTNPLLEMY